VGVNVAVFPSRETTIVPGTTNAPLDKVNVEFVMLREFMSLLNWIWTVVFDATPVALLTGTMLPWEWCRAC
jgi:hypothetical protein